jgi:hypothetical protein
MRGRPRRPRGERRAVAAACLWRRGACHSVGAGTRCVPQQAVLAAVHVSVGVPHSPAVVRCHPITHPPTHQLVATNQQTNKQPPNTHRATQQARLAAEEAQRAVKVREWRKGGGGCAVVRAARGDACARAASAVRLAARSAVHPPTHPPTHPPVCVSAAAAHTRAAPTPQVSVAVTRPTQPGEVVVLVGSHPSLGSWDLGAALRLSWSAGHVWRGDVTLPAGAGAFEYKVCARVRVRVRVCVGVCVCVCAWRQAVVCCVVVLLLRTGHHLRTIHLVHAPAPPPLPPTHPHTTHTHTHNTHTPHATGRGVLGHQLRLGGGRQPHGVPGRARRRRRHARARVQAVKGLHRAVLGQGWAVRGVAEGAQRRAAVAAAAARPHTCVCWLGRTGTDSKRLQ